MSDTPLKIMQGTALTDQQKTDLLHRLARVEGQLHGVQRMVARAAPPADCESIAQRMSAARKALDRAFVALFASAVTTHTGGALNMEEARDRAKTLAGLLGRFA